MFKIEKMDFLISVYIFCIAVSELMGSKTFPLLSLGSLKLNASVAIFVIPVIFSINDIISEVYGKERARSVVRSGLLIIGLILLFSLLAVALSPSKRFQASNTAYNQIFGISARIAAASLTAFSIAEFLDIFIFAKIKQKLGQERLWIRNNVSNIISQFFDTTIFMILAFYAFPKPFADNMAFLISLILPYWLLKCFMSVIETPLVYAGVAWLKDTKQSKH